MKAIKWSFALALAWSVIIFVGLNWILLVRRAPCFECGFWRGVPFIWFHDGSFGIESEIIWPGLLADILVALASGFVIGGTIHVVSARFGPQQVK